MARFISLIGILLLVFIVGCSQGSLFQKASPETETSAEIYFDLLRQHQFEQLEAEIDPSVKDPYLRSTLTNMAALIPGQNPQLVKAVGSHVSCNALTCDTDLLLEYRYPNEWLVVDELIRSESGVTSLMRFRIRPIPVSEIEANRFTLSGKGISQYTALVLAIFLPLYSLYALVLCIRTKELKKKWLWAAFIVIGLGKICVLWTTGLWSFNIFCVQLFSAGAVAQLYSPRVISLSIPLGAIVFLRYRKTLNTSTTQNVLPDAPTHPTDNIPKLGGDETGPDSMPH